MPNSPPLLPTSTLPFTTSGAIVIVSPRLMSPSVAFQTSAPVSRVDRNRVIVERVEDRSCRSRMHAPRFTTSQHATPCAAADGFGLNVHFTGAPGLRQVERVERCSGTA